MPSANVNDISLHYEIYGKGKSLVLIMGLGTDISEWNRIITPLAQKFRVLAFDNRGSGRSDKPDEPYSIKQMASDAAGVMHTAGFEHANVLGISMGGAIALELALDNPKLVERLILVSTSSKFIKRHRLKLFGLVRRLPIFESKYHQPNYAYARQHAAVLAFNCTNRLSELKIPVAILHGKRDKTVPLRLAEGVHADVKGSSMYVFKGGHLFMLLGQRRAFLQRVAEFIG